MTIVCVRIAQGTDISEFVPRLGTFAVAAFQILPSIANISACVSGLVFYRPTLEEAYDNITAAREYDKKNDEQARGSSEARLSEKSSPVEFKDKITVENIVWKYENSDKNVLEGLSLEIRKVNRLLLSVHPVRGKQRLQM